MPRRFLVAGGFLVSLLLASSRFEAQTLTRSDSAAAPRVAFNVGGGFAESAPFGGYSASSVGYSATAAVETRSAFSWLRLRGEGTFFSWGNEQHLTAFTASALAVSPLRWRAAPYLLGGGGIFSASRNGAFERGWTVGAGLRVPLGDRRALLLEARAHGYFVGAGGLRRSGLAISDVHYSPWQYSMTPLSLVVQF
jgi:hypothetical protein